MKPIPIFVLSAALLAAGCRSGGWGPQEPVGFSQHTVETSTRLGNVTALAFGGWRADSVKVSWNRGSGSSVGGSVARNREQSRGEYSYRLAGGGERPVRVSCQTTGSRASLGVRSVEIETSTVLGLACDMRAAERTAWRLELHGNDDGMSGTLVGDERLIRVAADPPSSRVLRSGPRGYRMTLDGEEMGAVDLKERVVWIRPGLPPETADGAAAAAAALLLYRTPLVD